MLGPTSCYNTERCESYNSLIRCRNIHSNRQAPSKVIANSFAIWESIRFAFAGSSYSPSERCGDDLIALYRSMGVQRYLGGTSVQHDKPIHQPELGSIVLNALDLGNYDLKDFNLLLPPGLTLSTIGHFAKAIVGADGKVINLCDHVVYTVEKRYSKQELFVAHFKPKLEPSVYMEPIVDAQQKPVFNSFD
eukprot:Em1024g1a